MQLFLSGQFLQSSELLINKSGFTIACKLHSYLFIVAYLVFQGNNSKQEEYYKEVEGTRCSDLYQGE